MNVPRIVLASVGGFVAYFAVGGLAFGAFPMMRKEFLKYPNVYRSQDAIKSVMPVGMAFMCVAIVVLAVLYAMLYQGGSRVAEGARFGALDGVFAICSFVVHNYVNLGHSAGGSEPSKGRPSSIQPWRACFLSRQDG